MTDKADGEALMQAEHDFWEQAILDRLKREATRRKAQATFEPERAKPEAEPDTNSNHPSSSV